jgi:hypothetical protein
LKTLALTTAATTTNTSTKLEKRRTLLNTNCIIEPGWLQHLERENTPGPTGLISPYVYEAIKIPDGTSYLIYTWKGQSIDSSPEIFTKIAFALLAIYKSSYGFLLVDHLKNLATQNGFMEGMISETGQVFGALTDNTNGMVVEAAAYAIYSG